jgi:hypothetical protein
MAAEPPVPQSGSLGSLVALHKRGVLDAVGPLVLALLIPAVASGLMLAAARFVPPEDRETLGKAWFLVAASLVGSFVFLWKWWKNHGLAVQVFEHGFVVLQRPAPQACRWDEIRELWLCTFDGPAPAYGRPVKKGTTVVRHDGTKLEVPSAVARPKELLERLRQETYRRMLPWALSQFQSGGLVSFGPYTLGRQGLTVAAPKISMAALMLTGGAAGIGAPAELQTVPWSEFSEIRLESRWIRLKRPGLRTDWYVVYQGVPNVHVLIALLQQVFTTNPSATAGP